MKQKSLFTPILLIAFALAACNTAGGAEPAAERDEVVSVDTDIEAEAEKVSVANCSEATPGGLQLIDAAQGICFLYPDNYDVFQSQGSDFTLYVRSLMNTEAPLASFSFEPANGRSLAEITAQRLADFAFPEAESHAITLGGEPASLLDDLPGQDTNRRVVTVHNGIVYDMMVARIGTDYGAVGTEAEALYDMITDSFQFIGIEPEAPLLAGPECPEMVDNSTLYTNETIGYCLLLPAGYTVLQVDPEATEIVFYVGTVQDTSHPRLSIKVMDANGRSLDELTTAHETETESALPGFDVMWSFGYMLDGVAANQFGLAGAFEQKGTVMKLWSAFADYVFRRRN
jgi:hypothetical protein